MTETEYNDIIEKIIGCACKVSNTLGPGFLEKVYENSLLLELRKSGMRAGQQIPIEVYYECVNVGEYFADILVENEIIIEVKTSKHLDEIHFAQLLNYLKATKKKLGLIINFAKPKVEIKRIVNNL